MRWMNLSRGQALKRAIAAVGFCLFAAASMAQYQVYSWENFESGVLPATLTPLHGTEPGTVAIFDYEQPGLPPEMVTPMARRECGRYGLRFQTLPDIGNQQHHIVSVVHHLVMDRARIGQRGRALFQADVYLPAESDFIPSPTVLAYSDSAPDRSWIAMYRFGLLQSRAAQFSYSDSDGAGKVVKADPPGVFPIARPGWHRVQIVFEGQDKIHCAVDGRETTFSPILEPSLVKLRPGFMAATAPGKSGSIVIDNLSIQWTPEDTPLPESPWTAAGMEALAASVNAPAPAAPGPGAAEDVSWSDDADQAWARAVRESRPVLLALYTPRARDWEALESLPQTDPAARAILARFVLLKMDANTLRGGMIAGKFGVFRVPTFIAVAPDGRILGQWQYSQKTPWPAIAAELKKF